MCHGVAYCLCFSYAVDRVPSSKLKQSSHPTLAAEQVRFTPSPYLQPHHNPQRFQDLYPNFTSILMNMLNNSQEQEGQLLALEVFGHIALKNEGKKMLLENNRVHEDFFEVLRNKIKSGTSETRVRALSVFADIIRSTEQEMVPDVSRQLFEKLDGVNTIIFITNLARKPFSGIHILITMVSLDSYSCLILLSSYSLEALYIFFKC